MPIHYGDLTIVYNPILQTWVEWIKGETVKEDQYVFLFEDNEICEVKDAYIDFKFNFLRINNELPGYFKKSRKEDHNNTYFNKDNPTFDLFNAYSKNDLCIKSNYNGIYYCYSTILLKPEIFGIKRIKSSENMPRYQFAYDTNEFTKKEIIYLLYSILKKN